MVRSRTQGAPSRSTRGGGVQLMALVCLGAGCSRPPAAGQVSFLGGSLALLEAMEQGDTRASEELGEDLLLRPAAALPLFDELRAGELSARQTRALANSAGIMTASFLLAPEHSASVGEGLKGAFMERSLLATLDLPTLESVYLLEVWRSARGLGPRHAPLLIALAQLPGRLGPAIEALAAISFEDSQPVDLAHLIEVYSADRSLLSPLQQDLGLTLILASGAQGSLQLLERAFDRARDDPDRMGELTAMGLRSPRSEALLHLLIHRWRGHSARPSLWSLFAGQVPVRHHAAAVELLASELDPAARDLLLELTTVDPGWMLWVASQARRNGERAFALRSLMRSEPALLSQALARGLVSAGDGARRARFGVWLDACLDAAELIELELQTLRALERALDLDPAPGLERSRRLDLLLP